MPADHMFRSFEVLLFVVRLGLCLIFVYFFACAGSYLRLRDLGVSLICTRRAQLLFLGPILIAATFEPAPWYWVPLAFFAWAGAIVFMVARRKPALPHWSEKDADSEIAGRIQALL